MSKEPELGQIAFGNPTGDFGTEEWQDALLDYLLEEIDRIYWNKNQRKWNRQDPEFKGVIFNPYYWGEDEKEASKPNFKIKGMSLEIRWYKYPGRGQSVNAEFSKEEWLEWFNKALEVIRKNENGDE